MVANLDDIHGTRSAYTRGCRCDDCKAAQTVYRKASRARGPLKDTVHGKVHTYVNLGCRCDECRTVARLDREKREARKAGVDDDGWIVT
jgi:hypothetical protein